MILRVGLTGGLASGKSTILRMLGELGCRTTDADSIVSSLYAPGRPGFEALVSAYGTGIVRPDGSIDRPRVASIAFADAEQAARLNALIHPLVVEEEARLMAAEEASGADTIYVVEATLLLESGGRQRYDRILVVDVPADVQLERAVRRGMHRDDALRRMENQMTRDLRLAAADYVIENTGDLAETRSRVAEIVGRLRSDLEEKKRLR